MVRNPKQKARRKTKKILNLIFSRLLELYLIQSSIIYDFFYQTNINAQIFTTEKFGPRDTDTDTDYMTSFKIW